MPLYEYECEKCGRFEVMQKTSEKPLKCNPDCTKKDCPKNAQRLVSASALQFKGSGWYKTDYASSSSSPKASSSSSSSSSESSSSSSDSSDKGKKKHGCGSGCGCH